MSTTYYTKLKGTQICDTSRNALGANNANLADSLKASELIYCVAIGQNGRDTAAGAYRLEWRVVGGTFAPVNSTGAVKYTTGTVLSQDTAVTEATLKVTVTGMTWVNGVEEEAGVAASINLGSDVWTEFQFGISLADGVRGKTYEFQLYNTTLGAALAVEDGSYATIGLATVGLTIAAGAMTVAGTAVGVKATRKLTITAGAITATGTAVTLTVGSALTHYALTIGSGSIAAAGTAIGLKAARKLTIAAGAITAAGTAITLQAARKLSLSAGAIVETGTGVGLGAARKLLLTSGTITEAGAAVVLQAARKIALESGLISLTGSAVTLTYASIGAYTLTLESGSIALAGTPVGLTYSGGAPSPKRIPSIPAMANIPNIGRRAIGG